MQGLMADEIAGYIEGTVGKVFSDEAINGIAFLSEAKNFLNLQNILVTLMSRAVAAGRKQVELEDVETEFGNGPATMSKRATSAGGKAPKKEAPQGGSEPLRSILGGQREERAVAGG